MLPLGPSTLAALRGYRCGIVGVDGNHKMHTKET
jgi:hypothetical protein